MLVSQVSVPVFVYPIDCRVKSIIFPVMSSTDNRLVRGVIRERCLIVAWDIAILRPLTGLRILCNQPVIHCNQYVYVTGKTGRLESTMNLDSYLSIFS